MVGQPCGNSRGAMQPTTSALSEIKRKTQAVVIGTEIVNTAQDKHARLQSLRLTSQSASAAGQVRQAFAKGGIEAFNESSVDAAVTLSGLDNGFNLVRTSLDDTTLDREGTSGTVFDHLHQVQFGPRVQLGSTRLTMTRQFGAKSAIEGSHIAGQAIDCNQ